MLVLEWRSYPEICDPQTMFSCIWNRIKNKTEIFFKPSINNRITAESFGNWTSGVRSKVWD